MLLLNANLKESSYAGYSFSSNWKDKQADFATNKIVHDFYNEKPASWFRTTKHTELKRFKYRLEKGDTLVVCLDRYALTGMSAGLIPGKILKKKGSFLASGEVLLCLVYLNENKSVTWRF